MKIRYGPRIFLAWYILLLPISLSLETHNILPIVSYLDETVSLFFAIWLMGKMLKGKLAKEDAFILVGLILFTLIGIASNIYSKVIPFKTSILIDAFVQWKIFVCFLGAKYIAKTDYYLQTIRYLKKASKWLLWLGTIFGIISQFVDLGMSADGSVRYGIKSYSFLLGNEGRYGIVIACALLIILYTTENKRNIFCYEMLALINIILTTKGVAYIIAALYVAFRLTFRMIEKRKKVSLKTVLPIAAVGVGVSGYQIQSYLLNDISPRMLLIRYGFITANTYFPFGSGFATYGSHEATIAYSPLYVKYGWSNKFTMGINSREALDDNYLATIIGESGYFGFVLFLSLLGLICLQVNQIKNLNIKCKSLVLSILSCLMICFLATGITKSSIGVMAFTVLGVFKGLDEINKEEC